MHTDSGSHTEARRVPARFQVCELISSRYGAPVSGRGFSCNPQRPLSWDERKEGVDVVRTLSGEEVKLYSSPMQSPPQPGWVVLITGGSGDTGYTWTLYGIPPQT
jgi:hypothetical protein